MEEIQNDTKGDYVVRFSCTGAEQACKSLAYYAAKKDKYFARDLLERCLRLRKDVDEAMSNVDSWLKELQELAFEEERVKTSIQRARIEGEPISDIQTVRIKPKEIDHSAIRNE